MKKINVVTLCSGYDSQCMALDVLKERHPDFDYELVAWSEIDKYAIQMHNIVYPQYADRNLGDMTKIDWKPIKEKYGEIDLLTYSTPCFVAGTMVTTDKGEVAIENIKEGDMVLTHTVNYRKVVRPMTKKFYGNLHKIGVNGRDIVCTPEHPFYVYNNEEEKFEWVNAEEIGAGWEIAMAQFDTEKNPLTTICEYNMTLIKRDDYVQVYNLEVEEDHSYTANGVIVHNCQSISQAGKQHGFEEGSGTRSAILWSTEEAIRVLKPKYLLQENVKNIISGYPNLTKKGTNETSFYGHLVKWMQRVESYGYRNDWTIINAKDMGVPQNRERFFLLSQRDDIYKYYEFPKPIPLTTHLEDVLEDEVDERFFLKDDAVSKFLEANNKDTAVFTQFSAPPCHEDAMFIKTWLHRWMKANNGWQMQPEQLKAAIEDAKQRLFPSDWRNSPEMQDEAFRAEYYTNLNRRRNQ